MLLEEVMKAAERAADLTRQLLAYAGKGRFVMRTVNLSDLVREISGLVQTSIPKTVQLRLQLADRLPGIDADPGQMQQIVMNLVINGAEAIGPEGGTRASPHRCPAGGRAVHRDHVFSAGELLAPGEYVFAGGARHRLRHGRGDAGQDLRSVLHHQVRRPRAGPVGRAGNRSRPQRRAEGLQQAGAGHHLQGAVSRFGRVR